MKLSVVFLAMITCLVNESPGQGLTEYKGFHVENGKVIWQKVYERPDRNVDQLKKMIYENVKLDATLNLLSESEDELLMMMKYKPLGKNEDLYSGRISIEVKEAKYRVTLSGGTSDPGQKTMRAGRIAGAIDGSGNDGMDAFKNYRFEEWLRKDGTLKPGKSLDNLDLWFSNAFDYKVLDATTKDW